MKNDIKKKRHNTQKRADKAKPANFAAVTHFPSPITNDSQKISKEEKIEYIADKFRDIMEILGLDLTNDSLKRTPYRIAKMYVNEIFSGLDYEQFPSISCFENCFQNKQGSHIVLVKVHFTSFCEHHFVPMNGYAFVAYIPNGKVIGLSKIPRIVRYFARRPQLQERLTAQIADSLAILLETENVAVSVTARHYCVIARGIEDENSHTITNVLRGKFDSDESIRKEFFEGINRN